MGSLSVTKRIYELTERNLPSEGSSATVKPSFPGMRRLITDEPPPSRLTTVSQPMLIISIASSSMVAPTLWEALPSMT